MPAFTPSRRTSPTFGWYSFYRPTEGRRLSRPMWLVTYRNKVPPLESNPDTVTHPSINRAQRRLTSLIETNDVHYATPPPNTISSVILSLKLWPKSTTFQAVARYVHKVCCRGGNARRTAVTELVWCAVVLRWLRAWNTAREASTARGWHNNESPCCKASPAAGRRRLQCPVYVCWRWLESQLRR